MQIVVHAGGRCDGSSVDRSAACRVVFVVFLRAISAAGHIGLALTAIAGLFVGVFVRFEICDECVDCVLGVVAVGLDGDRIAALGRQRQ